MGLERDADGTQRAASYGAIAITVTREDADDGADQATNDKHEKHFAFRGGRMVVSCGSTLNDNLQ
jgi:hypothetical protein